MQKVKHFVEVKKTVPHSAQRKHEFLVKAKEKYKSNKTTPSKKVALGLLHHRLGHQYNRSFMPGDTENV